MNVHSWSVQLPFGFRGIYRCLTFLILLFFWNPILRADDPDEISHEAAPLDRVASLGGMISCYAEKDNYLYVGQGDRLLICDQTNREDPKFVLSLPLSGISETMLLSGSKLTILSTPYSNYREPDQDCFDISDPIHPKKAESDESADEIYASVDTSITEPVSVKRLKGPLQNATDVWVNGNRAWVRDKDTGWLMVDIADPSNPKIIGRVGLPDGDSPRALLGSWVFGGSDKPGLRIYNADKPGTCTVLSEVPLKEPLRSLSIKDKTAFIAAGKAGLIAVDIADPTNPRALETYATTQSCTSVMARGNLAVIQADDLFLLDVTDPAHPLQKSKLWVSDMMTTDTTIVEEPLAPERSLHDWTLDGQTLILLWGENANYAGNNIQFFNTGNPSAPTQIKSIEGSPYDQFRILNSQDGWLVAHRYGWSSQTTQEYLQICDMHDPAKPRDLGRYECLSEMADFDIQGDFIYIADGSNGLLILKIRNGK